jgi:hypothetical protein
MQIHVEPDVGIAMPEGNISLSDFKERAEAACKSAEFLGLDMTPTEEDKQAAEEITYAVAENEPVASAKLAKKASQIRPATYGAVKGILDEFSIKVVDNAIQIRQLVTNKLLLETSSPDPRVRIRALELLGKISDVGLFTERSEVTINNRSTQELMTSLREKIQRLMYPQDNATDVEVIEVNGEKVNLDEELGLEPEKQEEKSDASPE